MPRYYPCRLLAALPALLAISCAEEEHVESSEAVIQTASVGSVCPIAGVVTMAPSYNPALCASVAGGSTANGAGLQLYQCFGGAAQQWNVVDRGGYCAFVSQNGAANKCMDNRGVLSDGQQVGQWDCSASNANQHWQVTALGAGKYSVVSRMSGKALDAAGWGNSNGTVIHQWTPQNSTNQQWLLAGAVAQEPGPGAGFTRCASEGQRCEFMGTRQVSYGANGKYRTMTQTGGVACNNSVFGDPLPGVVKACWVGPTSTSPDTVPTGAPGQHTTMGWVATDAVGRKLPTATEVGAPKTNKTVGMFYYLWHGPAKDADGIPLNWDADRTKAIAAHPMDPALHNPHVQVPGTAIWGEPEAGYYSADDPWVIRRNLSMLSNAGVDFIFFDGSNGWNYIPRVRALCSVADDLVASGVKVPKIAWMVRNVLDLHENFYAKQLCKQHWYLHDGKPLMMPISRERTSAVPQSVLAQYSIRYSWAWQNPAEGNNWQWLDLYPQDPGWSSTPSNPEQITVSKASHASNGGGAIGASYEKGTRLALDNHYVTAKTPLGLHFEEQWSRAHAVSPPVVMVTQWNEWIGGCHVSQNGGDWFLYRQLDAGQCQFIDAFNMEFNRDLEPMRNGYTDNYYYQLVGHVRRYKGWASHTSFSSKTIDPKGGFAQWQGVGPVYQDIKGDTLHRDWVGGIKSDATNSTNVRYTNKTGRNDLIEARASYDASNLYFYVRAAATLTPSSDANWMQLLVDADQNAGTGWLGYDYLISGVADASTMQLLKWSAGQWAVVDRVPYRTVGSMLHLSVPRAKLGETGSVAFDFHWVDNINVKLLSRGGELTPFFTEGDSAPDRRFNYRFGADPR